MQKSLSKFLSNMFSRISSPVSTSKVADSDWAVFVDLVTKLINWRTLSQSTSNLMEWSSNFSEQVN